jgi:hypothetical protein
MEIKRLFVDYRQKMEKIIVMWQEFEKSQLTMDENLGENNDASTINKSNRYKEREHIERLNFILSNVWELSKFEPFFFG